MCAAHHADDTDIRIFMHRFLLTDRDISRGARTIHRGIYTMCNSRFLHRALAGTALRQFQSIFHVYPAISDFNHYVCFHGNDYLP